MQLLLGYIHEFGFQICEHLMHQHMLLWQGAESAAGVSVKQPSALQGSPSPLSMIGEAFILA